MEEFLKRPIRDDELIHHVNGNKLDNRIENLKLVTRSEHGKIHYNSDVIHKKLHT